MLIKERQHRKKWTREVAGEKWLEVDVKENGCVNSKDEDEPVVIGIWWEERETITG